MISLKGSKMVRFNTDSPGPGQYHNLYVAMSQNAYFHQINILFPKTEVLLQLRKDPHLIAMKLVQKIKGILYLFPKKKGNLMVVRVKSNLVLGIIKILIGRNTSMNILSRNRKNILRKNRNFIIKNFCQVLVIMKLVGTDKKCRVTNLIKLYELLFALRKRQGQASTKVKLRCCSIEVEH